MTTSQIDLQAVKVKSYSRFIERYEIVNAQQQTVLMVDLVSTVGTWTAMADVAGPLGVETVYSPPVRGKERAVSELVRLVMGHQRYRLTIS